MSLHRLIGREIAVPAPDGLATSCRDLCRVGDGPNWGTADLPDEAGGR